MAKLLAPQLIEREVLGFTLGPAPDFSENLQTLPVRSHKNIFYKKVFKYLQYNKHEKDKYGIKQPPQGFIIL